MNEKEFKKLVIKSINSSKSIDLKSYEWDSLVQLTLLLELEKIFPNKITSIKGLAEVNNYNKMKKILVSKKILKND